MVAVAQFIPKDPKEKESVLAVLREHPELQDLIARVSEKAEEMFPEVSISLDTVQYDDWDPPVRMLIHITQDWNDYKQSSEAFRHWLAYLPGYEREHIFVMSMWAGPVETARQ
ncbi:MAG: hypothetical protein WKF63_05120 [Thermomicrobiales bacterium]